MKSSSLRQGAFLCALAVGVTIGGAAVGSLDSLATLGSPDALHDLADGWRTLPASMKRLTLPVLFGVVSLVGFVATGISLYRRRPDIKLPSIPTLLAETSSSPRAAKWTTPRSTRALGRAPGRSASKTPKAVQALADSGTEPTEIAWRTGLSLDAVAMLLSIGSTHRQLQPPTA